MASFSDDEEDGKWLKAFGRAGVGLGDEPRTLEGADEDSDGPERPSKVLARVEERRYSGFVVGFEDSIPVRLADRGMSCERWARTIHSLNENSFTCRGAMPLAFLCLVVQAVLVLLALAFLGKRTHGFRDLPLGESAAGALFILATFLVLVFIFILWLGLYLVSRPSTTEYYLRVENTLFYNPRGLGLVLTYNKKSRTRVLEVIDHFVV